MATDPTRRRRWAASHGAARGLATRRARDGVVDARLLVDPAAREDPWPLWEQLRAEYPFAAGAVPNMLATVHYDVVREVITSDAFGMPVNTSSGPDVPPGPQDPPSLIALDGEAHARHRTRLAGSFSARRMNQVVPRVEAIAARLLADLPAAAGPDGVVDLVAGYAHPLPLGVITELLGLPADGDPLPAELPRWGDVIVAALDSTQSWAQFDAAEDDLVALRDWLRRQVASARASADRGAGLLALLAVDGGPDEDDDLLVTLMFLLAAGFETTTHLLSSGAARLATLPHHVAALRDDPAGWPAVVDELLRLEAPVTRAARRALRDVEVAGTTVPAGTLVMAHTAAANRDPAVFSDPTAFDPARPDVRAHLAFGHGPHHCLGAGLARMESAVGLRMLFERFPDLRPVGPGDRRPTTLVRGRATLPVRLS